MKPLDSVGRSGEVSISVRMVDERVRKYRFEVDRGRIEGQYREVGCHEAIS